MMAMIQNRGRNRIYLPLTFLSFAHIISSRHLLYNHTDTDTGLTNVWRVVSGEYVRVKCV